MERPTTRARRGCSSEDVSVTRRVTNTRAATPRATAMASGARAGPAVCAGVSWFAAVASLMLLR